MPDHTRFQVRPLRRREAAGHGLVIDAFNMVELTDARRAADLNRFKVATSNARDGATMLQVVRGSLAGIADRLAEMRILTTQAAAETRSDVERAALGRQFAERRAEIDRIADAASFSGVRLLCGGTRVEEDVEQVTSQRFSAFELGFNLRREAGFGSFRFEADTPTIEAGDRIRVEYQSDGRRFTISNTTTGRAAHVVQPRHVALRGGAAAFKVPEFGLTVQLAEAFPYDLDNPALPGGLAANELRVGMTSRRETRTVVMNALELIFQVGWRGGDRDRIMLHLPSARVADLDRDLATADISSVPKARHCLALVRRAALEVARIRAYVEMMEEIFDSASERLAMSADTAHAPEQEKVVFIAKVALARASLGRVGTHGARPGRGGFLAARSIPVMRNLLLDLARAC